MTSGGERGLLSMAFSPHYPTNHLFYVSYDDLDGDSRIVQYRSSNGVGVRSSAKILLAVQQPYSNHKGGQLEFDKRGYLYIGFGDGGSEDDPNLTSQDMSTRLGKLLRSTTASPNGSWRVVALGLRNPWRFSFDSRTNDLWIGDVGQDDWEGIDFRPVAKLDTLANYGWSRYEGNVVFDPSHRYTNVGEKTFPVLVYSHAHCCSVTGGYVYRGTAVPAARGRYFYGDYCAGTIWSFPVSATGRAGSRDGGAADRVTAHGHREQRDVRSGRGLDGAGAEARVGGEPRLQLREVGRDEGAASSFDDDLGRVRVLSRERPLEREVAPLRGQVVRQGGDAAGADVEAEGGDGQREHQPGAEDEAQDGSTQDAPR